MDSIEIIKRIPILLFNLKSTYNECIIHKPSKEIIIYQYWKEASHFSKDNYYLVKGEK